MIALLVAIYVPLVLEISHLKPLWHDELYTLFIARASSVREMWDLARIYDLNPPLPFLLTRASYRLLGVNTLATRLPEMIGFLAALLCLFAIVRRRMGVLYGLFAAYLLMASVMFQLAAEARPYGLMYGFFLAAVLCWQRSAELSVMHRWRWLIALSLALACLFLSHVFGAVAAATLVGAEFVRAISRRRVDWPMLAALAIPFGVTALYAPLFQNHHTAIYPASFVPGPAMLLQFYAYSMRQEFLIAVLTLMAVILSLSRHQISLARPSAGPRWSFTPAECFLLAGVLALPLALMLLLMHSHGAFYVRYGSIANFAFAPIVAALLGGITLRSINGGRKLDPRVALLGCIVAICASDAPMLIPRGIADGGILPTPLHGEPRLLPCDACAKTAALDPSLPLVEASGLVFVEMSYRENDATLSRLYYLTDSDASARIAHANIFERMPAVVDAFHLHSHSEAYAAFTAQHRHFFVLGKMDYPEDWLLPKLKEDGATLKLLGQMRDDYWRTTELYEVTLPNAPVAH
ncbi:4-amino-4-deoxy-L-arabinose transferase [Bryocella elongata]|uniref:4-amino-4-deoxy-L-arabinose transferase n=1 Tax=Bryocella elongata TaxID=863522 RepID=A0A1H5UNI5_9BACT|nr:glycosyltransferase family 39 protein [Bryocella elongata]SEF75991.1 4-amino-4-deoxy-L-arabinose transferase [Bryocella elongata]